MRHAKGIANETFDLMGPDAFDQAVEEKWPANAIQLETWKAIYDGYVEIQDVFKKGDIK